MTSQNLNALSMKGADDRLWPVRLFLGNAPFGTSGTSLTLCLYDQFTNAFLHFAGRFVGESHCQNAFGRSAIADQIGNPKSHHAGLSRSRSRQYQHRATQGGYRFGLWPVQSMIISVQSVPRKF